MKPATEILLSAAFVLTPKENWFDDIRKVQEHQMCAYIAISDAAAELFPTVSYTATSAACEAFQEAIRAGGDPRATVILFNDTHTHAEVLDALYRAAELAEAA